MHGIQIFFSGFWVNSRGVTGLEAGTRSSSTAAWEGPGAGPDTDLLISLPGVDPDPDPDPDPGCCCGGGEAERSFMPTGRCADL